MKRITLIIALTLGLSGCAILPSFWDDNEASAINNIVSDVNLIDCAKKEYTYLYKAQYDTDWLISYSTIKGSKDVVSMVGKIKQTMDPFVDKAKSGEMSTSYCNLKKQILQKDTQRTAKAMLGRF